MTWRSGDMEGTVTVKTTRRARSVFDDSGRSRSYGPTTTRMSPVRFSSITRAVDDYEDRYASRKQDRALLDNISNRLMYEVAFPSSGMVHGRGITPYLADSYMVPRSRRDAYTFYQSLPEIVTEVVHAKRHFSVPPTHFRTGYYGLDDLSPFIPGNMGRRIVNDNKYAPPFQVYYPTNHLSALSYAHTPTRTYYSGASPRYSPSYSFGDVNRPSVGAPSYSFGDTTRPSVGASKPAYSYDDMYITSPRKSRGKPRYSFDELDLPKPIRTYQPAFIPKPSKPAFYSLDDIYLPRKRVAPPPPSKIYSYDDMYVPSALSKYPVDRPYSRMYTNSSPVRSTPALHRYRTYYVDDYIYPVYKNKATFSPLYEPVAVPSVKEISRSTRRGRSLSPQRTIITSVDRSNYIHTPSLLTVAAPLRHRDTGFKIPAIYKYDVDLDKPPKYKKDEADLTTKRKHFNFLAEKPTATPIYRPAPVSFRTVYRAGSEPPLGRTLPTSADLAVRNARRQLSRVESELGGFGSDDYDLGGYGLPPRAPTRPFVNTRQVTSRRPTGSIYRRASISAPSNRVQDIQNRIEIMTEPETGLSPQSYTSLRSRTAEARAKMDHTRTLLDRYLPLPVGPFPEVEHEVALKYHELAERMPILEQNFRKGGHVGPVSPNVTPYKPAVKHRPPTGGSAYQSYGSNVSRAPPVSDVRRRARQVLCKTRGDPNYY